MTNSRLSENPIYGAAVVHANKGRDGKHSRLEFLTRTAGFGVSAATAYSLIGLTPGALSIVDAEDRREVAARDEALIQEGDVTVQPHWRSLYRRMKEGFVGTDMHAPFEHAIGRLVANRSPFGAGAL